MISILFKGREGRRKAVPRPRQDGDLYGEEVRGAQGRRRGGGRDDRGQRLHPRLEGVAEIRTSMTDRQTLWHRDPCFHATHLNWPTM